uniref:Steroid 17-alpha-hydroxylase/17,20 lyase-like n=1 Tax=Saccoglossus kowalevskii TaxID=10224 RepID=A0ABM0LTV0_SACKO|nr:PREDICTED: steroid 17-alpha-hydroxylase/17,20 lyase-like [Saccoglossus kowalevskii]
MNEKKWVNPYKFNPDRFMVDGITNKNHVIPFSIGLRACPGQDFAKVNIFTIITRLMQNFMFKLPPGSKAPSMVGKTGEARQAFDYDVVFEIRHK